MADKVFLAYRGTMVAGNAVVLVALAALGVVVARNGSFKHHGSVARRGFLWFQIALWLTVLVYLFALVTTAGSLARYTGVRNSTPVSEMAFERLSIINTFFDVTAAAILMSCIAKLIVGTKAVVKQQKSSKYGTFITAFVALAILMSFIVMVMRQIIVVRYIRDFRLIFSQIRVASGSMDVAAMGLLLIGGLANTIFAWIQRRATRKEAGGVYSKVGNYISAIASIQFFVFAWTFISGIVFTLGFGSRNIDGVGWFLASLFITHISAFVMFWLIYKLGKKQEGGLWDASEAHESAAVPKSSTDISVNHV